MAEALPALPSRVDAMAVDEGSQPVDLVKHPSGIVPVLQNIVSTVNMDCRLDLKTIALRARNAEYNPKRFAAVIIRIREPKTTALVFASGKMVCTGAKSEEQSRLAARKYARIIQKLGFDQVKFKDFKIQNIVGSCDVRFPIKLEGLQIAHQQFCSYEPELFPGLIYRMKQPKIVLLIFVSGKIVLTGAKVSTNSAHACSLFSFLPRSYRMLPTLRFEMKFTKHLKTYIQCFLSSERYKQSLLQLLLKHSHSHLF
eukprot:TRINITY_DN4907_c0_g1_i4.p1 TRINITY_DN4907_c0_g1~~TRINITY_DN4907_c0_g1_i4.p1  ORF type:complete len:255 (-),score=23.56 TRINITY_DN4907_c0_g1_i4:297-1061(-)